MAIEPAAVRNGPQTITHGQVCEAKARQVFFSATIFLINDSL
jgi:hypothetical protein